MKNNLYLLRHGHVESNGILLGQTDVSLSKRGREQAKYWQKILQNIDFQAAWVSPLKRAVETAEIILQKNVSNAFVEQIYAENIFSEQVCIKKVSEFTEISLGLWDGKSKQWIQENDSKRWIERGHNMECVAPPDGESFSDLSKRVMPKFYEICQQAKSYEHSLLVAHQAVNRVILSNILGRSLKEIQNLEQDYACLNLLDITNELRIVNYESCSV